MDKYNGERYRDATIALICANNIKGDVKTLADWLESNKGLTSEFEGARETISDILWNLGAIEGAMDKWEKR